MDIRHFRYFIAIAEAKSFVAAARELKVSQPALSNRVKELERWAGKTLFERSSRGVRLTDDGERLIPYGRDVMDAFARAERSVAGRRSLTLAMGVTPTPEAAIIPRLVVAAADAKPSFRLQINRASTDELIEHVKRNRMHTALCYRTVNAAPLVTIPLYTEDLCLVGPARLVDTAAGEIDFKELASFPLVLDPPRHLTRRRVDDAAFRTRTKLDVRQEVEPANARKAIIERQGCCTVVSRSLYADAIRSKVFGSRRITNPSLSRTLSLIVNSSISQRSMTRLCSMIRFEVERLIATGELDWRAAIPAEGRIKA